MVTDPSGAVLQGCEVTISSANTGFTVHTTTSSTGTYYVSGLNPGTYAVRVNARGFRAASATVKVEVGRETRNDVRVEVGAAADSINVSAMDVRPDTVSATLEGVVSGPTIREQPLNGRQFLELAQLEPGVQVNDGGSVVGLKDSYAGVSVNGHSGLTARVTVDGLDISDEMMGSIVQNISLDAVEEFQISRSAADVATALNGAGAVNIATKSGTNGFHGTTFFFWRDSALAARIAAQDFPFDREQGGFALGGPVRRNQLFAFVSYERTNQDSAIATEVPGFPQFSSTWPLPFDEQMALARVDANLGHSTRAFVRFTNNGNTGVAKGFGGMSLSPQLQRNNANQTAAGVDASIGRSTHSFRFGYLNYDFFNDDGIPAIAGLPVSADPGGRALTVGLSALGLRIGTNSNAFARRLQDSDEFRYDGGFQEGSHVLRWGGVVDFIRAQWFSPVYSTPSLNLTYNSQYAAICGSDLLCYPVNGGSIGNGLGYLSEKPGFGEPFGTFSNNRVGAYVADNWRVTARLSLNAGLRWSYEPGQDNSDLNKPAVLDLFEVGLAKRNRTPNSNLAPQIGFAWAPLRSNTWVVRGAAGLHYDTKLMRDRRWERVNLLPAGVGNIAVGLPSQKLVNPISLTTIFDLAGADSTALITPGINWISGCHDPRFPSGLCPLGTPGLIDAYLAAAEAFRAAHARAMEVYPAGPGRCEALRQCNTFDLAYHTPYSLQINFGIQRELRPGLVLSVDYVHHHGFHYQIAPDANRMGAADSLDVTKALTAIAAGNSALGCGNSASASAIDCAIGRHATILTYAGWGMGRGVGATSSAPSKMAFPGNNPAFNTVNVYRMDGWSRYNALDMNLHGRLPDISTAARNWVVTASYALSRYEGTAGDQDLWWSEDYYPNDHPTGYYGPTTLDRTHTLGVSTTLDLRGGFRVSTIWRTLSPLSQNILLPSQNAGNAEIFKTDLNGDGTVADPLPGTNRGAYGRGAGCGAAALNRLIIAYNANTAGRPTPAGQKLVDAGLFTTDQLVSLGAVAPTISPAPAGQLCLDWFSTTDIRIARPIKIHGDRMSIEPAWEWFNLFNTANFDLPSDRLDGHLTGIVGAINGTTAANRPNRASLSRGSFSGGSPRSWQFALRINF